ncbi:hypothetical protein GDO81_012759 [Engystomops pustulosus]|uniref:Uncharacterized protein n=1 Tax=Engystomops pustulosus TaxID=76066 RepID=A0AAV7B112_ENGPU|nr:hypothetical protein GDO81_012759 [Engystomops pustulosus]
MKFLPAPILKSTGKPPIVCNTKTSQSNNEREGTAKIRISGKFKENIRQRLVHLSPTHDQIRLFTYFRKKKLNEYIYIFSDIINYISIYYHLHY